MVLFPGCLIGMLPHLSARGAFYGGILLGVAVYAPELGFFWRLFGAGAILLWLILSLWLAGFLSLGRLVVHRYGLRIGLLLTPFLWTGLEYFRSELYYLRFSWINVGYAMSGTPLHVLLHAWGVYGVGFLSAAAGAAWLAADGGGRRVAHVLAVAGSALLVAGWHPSASAGRDVIPVAGLQLEDADVEEVPQRLSRLVDSCPEARLIVLQEYLLGGEVPPALKGWCREHGRWLVVGGKRQTEGVRWQNTAFVVNPGGEVVFRQGKSVPIQFVDDGVAADSQKLWESPWGRIGIAICYDLSYSRVMDRLVEQGAQGLLIPTMDSIEWGSAQHRLHARVAPARAAEYGVGIFRVASSGISQLVDPSGRVDAEAPCPGSGAEIHGSLVLVDRGGLPLDRWIAPACVAISGILILLLALPMRRAGRGMDGLRGEGP
ncbi:MAG TPA: hypothetical protein DCM86_19730 [Verrucomicrobiales bacterium]|nr:hypothetical protein [Verrucomicrobiales bacterium]